MAFRRHIDNHPVIAAGVAVSVMIAAALFAARQTSLFHGNQTNDRAYFYDLETGQRFVGNLHQPPPVDAPSGSGNGVRVHVFGCGSCEKRNLVNGYLESFTEKGHKAAVALRQTTDIGRHEELRAIVNAERIYRGVDGDQWHQATSPAGQQIVRQATEKACPDGVVSGRCLPD